MSVSQTLLTAHEFRVLDPWNKPRNILSDYDLEDSEESSGSDSDEAETEENEDSDGSDNSEDDLPTVIDPATSEGLFRPRQTDKKPKMSETRQAHQEPVLQPEEHGIKRRRPTTKDRKTGPPPREGMKPKGEDLDEASDETDEDVEYDDEGVVDDDVDGDMFGDMGRAGSA